jgi:hypothetical protein
VAESYFSLSDEDRAEVFAAKPALLLPIGLLALNLTGWQRE